MTDRHSTRPARRLVSLTWGAFVLIGWTSVLVPALLPQIEARFGVDDAAIGIYYFAYSAAYATASFAGGLLTERLGRSVVLPAMTGLAGIGLLLTGVAPSWPIFLAAAIPLGAGAGAIDGGVNGLALAMFDEGRGRALNLLHLFFAVGALVSPAVVGQLVARGIAWEPIFLFTAAAAVAVAAGFRMTTMPSGVRGRREEPDTARPVRAGTNGRGFGSAVVPLILLAIAIGCYVASEVGVSNWIVRFLAAAPITLATAALSAFWGGLAVGRLFAARYADRFSHTAFAAIACVVAGIGIVAGVAAPTPELSLVGFAISGFASGPIFPMIVALGGDLYPDRLAATTGTLTGAAVVGGTIYPPLVGLMSARFGIATGLLGAAILSFAAAGAIIIAARTRTRTRTGRALVDAG